jgi:TRAP-type mannitol/chloroaromatic compound transport system substrate-binding protein
MGASVAQLPGPEILPAMERGVIEAFEFNNPTSDMRFGAQDVAKFYYMGSYHQASETFEITFNKAKFDSLSKEQQAILRLAGQAAAADNEWKAWDQYSKDLQTLITKDKVNVRRTSKAIFDAQLKAWAQVEADLIKDPAQGPFIKKVLDSQKEWTKRVGFYFFNNDADYRTAYEHHFGAIKT